MAKVTGVNLERNLIALFSPSSVPRCFLENKTKVVGNTTMRDKALQGHVRGGHTDRSSGFILCLYDRLTAMFTR